MISSKRIIGLAILAIAAAGTAAGCGGPAESQGAAGKADMFRTSPTSNVCASAPGMLKIIHRDWKEELSWVARPDRQEDDGSYWIYFITSSQIGQWSLLGVNTQNTGLACGIDMGKGLWVDQSGNYAGLDSQSEEWGPGPASHLEDDEGWRLRYATTRVDAEETFSNGALTNSDLVVSETVAAIARDAGNEELQQKIDALVARAMLPADQRE